uniref:Major facilitator superfamily (MFS) profile domain-containing protein n=1 Tax=Biomphalaria glabrata TaxID=6526 RepID=A0A2C9KK87_BIOGL
MASERTQLLASGNSYRRPSLRGNGQVDSSEDYQGEIIKDEVSLCCSYRLGVIICCTFAMTITFAVQASMSSAMVCMLEDPLVDIPLTNSSNWTLLEYNHTDMNQTGQEWKFPWDKTSQGWALSSFFVGYYVSQLPSGIASARFGAKKVVVLGLTLTAVFQLLTVPAAYYGLGWLYADRIIVGFIDVSMELGDMVSFGISLFACELPIQGGWPFVFYTMSAIGLVLAIFFVLFVSDSPFDNRLMSEAEVSFIASSIPKVEEKSARALAKIPVKEILKSMPVWAIVVSQIGSDWMYYCILTVSPTYLKEIIKLSNLEINLLSGVPFLFIIPTIYLSGYISDKVVMKGMLSNTSVRKINDAF